MAVAKKKKKTKKAIDKKPMGRPPVVTDEVIRKLEDAFANGATDLQACFYAGIGKTAFYDWQKDNLDFTERKEALKASLGLISKNTLAKSIKQGNVNDAKWHLERTEKDTYSTKQEHVATTDININISDISPEDAMLRYKEITKAITVKK